jgi:uncharacterized protein YbjT (DUF2867 family)
MTYFCRAMVCGSSPICRFGVKKILFISSTGIYDSPVKWVLKPYRKAAGVIEGSDLEYTILRPTWFTDVDYETTRKGDPEEALSFLKKALQH